jgi:hypothetical protein
MLWYKSWLETRWRFLIGLGLLSIAACGAVFDYPTVLKLMPLANNIETTIDTSTKIGRLVKQAAALQATYRGFIWWQWVRQNLVGIWTVFAVLLGSGGLIAASGSGGGGALFTLSLPASRTRVIGVRAVTALGELLVLVVVPSLLIPLLSPAIGQSYSIVDAFVHALCIFVAGAAFFSLAFLLSTVFSDLWRPLLITGAIACVLALLEGALALQSIQIGIFRVMSGESYFRGTGLPWLGLLASAAVSAALLNAAARNIARQDF